MEPAVIVSAPWSDADDSAEHQQEKNGCHCATGQCSSGVSFDPARPKLLSSLSKVVVAQGDNQWQSTSFAYS